MALLVHTGDEKAVIGQHPELQKLGNPLLLRKALEKGCKVIMAHCATMGKNRDLDFKGEPKPLVENFDLFLRMMEEKKYEGLLFADISAITQFNRMKYISKLLEKKEFHHRLVNGSDYPLPLVPMLTMTMPFESGKLITEEERVFLNEIQLINPLLFDFVLKRTLRGPKGEKFSDCIFVRNKRLGLFEDNQLEKKTPSVNLQKVFIWDTLPPCETWAEKQAHKYANRMKKYYKEKLLENKALKVAICGRPTIFHTEFPYWLWDTNYKMRLRDVVTEWSTSSEHPNFSFLLVQVLIQFFQHFGGDSNQVQRVLDNPSNRKKTLSDEPIESGGEGEEKEGKGVITFMKKYTTDLIWTGYNKLRGNKDSNSFNSPSTSAPSTSSSSNKNNSATSSVAPLFSPSILSKMRKDEEDSEEQSEERLEESITFTSEEDSDNFEEFEEEQIGVQSFGELEELQFDWQEIPEEDKRANALELKRELKIVEPNREIRKEEKREEDEYDKKTAAVKDQIAEEVEDVIEERYKQESGKEGKEKNAEEEERF